MQTLGFKVSEETACCYIHVAAKSQLFGTTLVKQPPRCVAPTNGRGQHSARTESSGPGPSWDERDQNGAIDSFPGDRKI